MVKRGCGKSLSARKAAEPLRPTARVEAGKLKSEKQERGQAHLPDPETFKLERDNAGESC